MGTKSILFVIVIVALVAGGLFLGFRHISAAARSAPPPQATLPDDGPADAVADGADNGTPPGPGGTRSGAGDRLHTGAGGTSAGGGGSQGTAPSGPMTSSGPRDQRLPHLQSTVTAEQVAEAHRILETDSNSDRRERAMVTLVRDREKANRDFFVATLRDMSEDPRVRATAATGLGRIGALDTVPDLLNAMDDDAAILRARAGAAVSHLTGRNYHFNANAPREERLMVIDNIRGSGPANWRGGN